MKTYADFEIWIDPPADPPAPGAPLVCPVRVTDSLAGPASGTLELNLETIDADLILVRDITADRELRKRFGSILFQALFRDAVRDAWRTSRDRVDAGQADGLRLRLLVNVPQLASLPWEHLHEEGKGFLATDAGLALARYLPVPEPPLLGAQEKLRILLVVEGPEKLPIKAQEVENLENVLNDLGAGVEYHKLQNVPVAEIQNALQQEFQVLHFLGHGTAGKLALVQPDGRKSHFIDAEEFAQLFLGRRSLRLVMLNACYSAQPAEGGLFSGIGPALVQKRLPAVIAMQYPTVLQTTAGQFSRAFYRALANGIPVDFAVNEARQQLSAGELLDGRDWSTPVLYMGTRSGRILEFARQDADEIDHAWQSVKAVAQASEQAERGLHELSQRFREVSDRHRELDGLVALSTHLADVQTSFDPCVVILSQAGWNAMTLSQGASFMQLQMAWQQLRNNPWIQLDVFVEGSPTLDADAWYPGLQKQATTIDEDLDNISIGPVVNGMRAFQTRLRQAEAQVRLQLDRSVDDLVTLSNRTLGRLTVA